MSVHFSLSASVPILPSQHHLTACTQPIARTRPNCVRELLRAVLKGKPLIVLLEPELLRRETFPEAVHARRVLGG